MVSYTFELKDDLDPIWLIWTVQIESQWLIYQTVLIPKNGLLPSSTIYSATAGWSITFFAIQFIIGACLAKRVFASIN